MVWDNLKSTSPIKALPIIDDRTDSWRIDEKKGQTSIQKHQLEHSLHVTNQKVVVLEFKTNIVNGVLFIEVINSGVGYGFDPADTFCPKEQYGSKVDKQNLKQHVNDGEYHRTNGNR